MAPNKNLNKETPPTSWKWKKKKSVKPLDQRGNQDTIQTFGFL